MGTSNKKQYHSPGKVSAMTVRISPRKVRIVVDLIRGLDVYEALQRLRFTTKRAARVVEALIGSAMSNLGEGGEWCSDDVKVKAAWVNEGPTLRRYMPRAMGRATRIRKRTSHIHVVLEREQA